jgi:Na+-transporting methylmalonyl-CoA/oxaloacetate decarboxylase gamma subunit
MKRKFTILLFLIAFSGFSGAFGQSAADFRINEYLVLNDSGYIDDFGQHSPWIEIFNSAHNYVNLGGCYLTNDLNNPKKYLIPKGDPITLIPPRGYLVFWADNKTTNGIRHLNFHLAESRFIALFDANGRTLIDSVSIKTSKRDISYGRLPDGENSWIYLTKTTPNANNDTRVLESASQKFQKLDPIGIGMSAIAMAVVFLVLILLFTAFNVFSRTIMSRERKKRAKLEAGHVEELELTDELAAAIGMALHMYVRDMQNYEEMKLTLNQVSKAYNPWSSKIYGVGLLSSKK